MQTEMKPEIEIFEQMRDLIVALNRRVQELEKTIAVLHEQSRVLYSGLELHQKAILELAALESPAAQPAPSGAIN